MGDDPNRRCGVAGMDNGADETNWLTLLGSGADDVAADVTVQKVFASVSYTTEKKSVPYLFQALIV